MKKVKIFLASSIEDLKDDRLAIGDYFRQLNEIYLDSGVHFSLVKCEDYDNAIVSGGKQLAYDREIRESELCFFLFYRKVGDYTRHEFDVALDAFRQFDKPKIVTYIRYVTDLCDVQADVRAFMTMLDGELHHYYNTYNHIDTLKLGILMQIKMMGLDASKIDLSDGVIKLNERPLFACDNIPLFRGNDSLSDLREEKAACQSMLQKTRLAYLDDPSEDNENAFFEASGKLNRVSKQLTLLEKEMLSFASTVAEMTAKGDVLTYRQKEALQFFNAGQYDRAQAILNDEERENELERAMNRVESGKSEIQGYVEEELLWISSEIARGVSEKNADIIVSRYEKIKALSETYDLKKNFWFGYLNFLQYLTRYEAALAVVDKLLWYYDVPNSPYSEEEKGKLFLKRGMILTSLRRFPEAEEAYAKAQTVFITLGKNKPELYEIELASLNVSLGHLYLGMSEYEKSEAAYSEAEVVVDRYYAADPKRYYIFHSTLHNNMALLFSELRQFEKAVEHSKTAIETLEKCGDTEIESVRMMLANSCANLGKTYVMVGNSKEAERLFLYSSEVQEKLADHNPEAYEAVWALILNNLGYFYQSESNLDMAVDFYERALVIEKRVCRRDFESNAPILVTIYTNIGLVCQQLEQYKKAELSYNEALGISEKLYEKDPDTNEAALMTLLTNYASLLLNTKRFEEADRLYERVFAIFKKFFPKNPMASLPYAETIYQNYALTRYMLDDLQGAKELLEEGYDLFLECNEMTSGGFKATLEGFQFLTEMILSDEEDD